MAEWVKDHAVGILTGKYTAPASRLISASIALTIMKC
jgi:hypothetical protein